MYNYAKIISSFSICVWGTRFSCNWIKSGFNILSWTIFLPWKARGRPLLCWFSGLNISGSRSLWFFFFGIPGDCDSSCRHILFQKAQRGTMGYGGKVASVSQDKRCFQILLGGTDVSLMTISSCKRVYDSKYFFLNKTVGSNEQNQESVRKI